MCRQVLCRGAGPGRAARAPLPLAKHEHELSSLKPGGAQSNCSGLLSTLHWEGSAQPVCHTPIPLAPQPGHKSGFSSCEPRCRGQISLFENGEERNGRNLCSLMTLFILPPLQSIAIFSHRMPVIHSFWPDLSIFFLVSCNLFYLLRDPYTW